MFLYDSKSYYPVNLSEIIKDNKVYYNRSSRGADRFFARISPPGNGQFMTADGRKLLCMR